MPLPLRAFFRLAFRLSWGLGGLGLLTGWLLKGPFSTASPLYLLAGFGVSIAGIAMTGKYEGRAGVVALLRRVIPKGIVWNAAVIALYAAIAFGSGQPVTTRLTPALLLDAGPLGEEFGWRGFALPRLIEAYGPLKATAVLAIIHTLWHVPLFFIPGMPQAQLSFPVFALEVASFTVLQTALHLLSGGDLSVAILAHALANVGAGVIGPGGFLFFTIAQTIGAVLLWKLAFATFSRA